MSPSGVEMTWRFMPWRPDLGHPAGTGRSRADRAGGQGPARPKDEKAPWTLGSLAASALRMRRREMLGERQVAAPLMAQRAAHRARRPAHRRFQPGEGIGVQLAGLRPSGKPHRPPPRQFGHQTLVLALALIAPAASRPGQHCAVRRQRGRQVAPCGHSSTVGQRFPHLVLRDDHQERRRPGWRRARGSHRACQVPAARRRLFGTHGLDLAGHPVMKAGGPEP